MRIKTWLLAVLSLTLAGCVDLPGTRDSEAKVDPCEGIATLLQSYQKQFADIRLSHRSFDRIDIWSSSFQLVGSGCEIWGWQGGKYNYVCNYVAPNEETARELYTNAMGKIQQCANDAWRHESRTTQDGLGQQSVWHKRDFSGMVDLKLVQTRGVGKPRWAIYLLIGDYNSQL